jgi:hypothetical protein
MKELKMSHIEKVKSPRRSRDKFISQQELVERTALTLYEAGEADLARQYLTYYGHTEALEGLRLVEGLSHSIELKTKLLFKIRRPNSKK